MQNSLAKNAADASRTTAADAYNTAFTDSMDVSKLMGGNYENAKNREIQNADLQKNYLTALMSGQSGLMGNLADMLKAQANNNTSANQQTLQNYLGYSGSYNDAASHQHDTNAADQAARNKWQWQQDRYNQLYGQPQQTVPKQTLPNTRSRGYLG